MTHARSHFMGAILIHAHGSTHGDVNACFIFEPFNSPRSEYAYGVQLYLL